MSLQCLRRECIGQRVVHASLFRVKEPHPGYESFAEKKVIEVTKHVYEMFCHLGMQRRTSGRIRADFLEYFSQNYSTILVSHLEFRV